MLFDWSRIIDDDELLASIQNAAHRLTPRVIQTKPLPTTPWSRFPRDGAKKPKGKNRALEDSDDGSEDEETASALLGKEDNGKNRALGNMEQGGSRLDSGGHGNIPYTAGPWSIQLQYQSVLGGQWKMCEVSVRRRALYMRMWRRGRPGWI